MLGVGASAGASGVPTVSGHLLPLQRGDFPWFGSVANSHCAGRRRARGDAGRRRNRGLRSRRCAVDVQGGCIDHRPRTIRVCVAEHGGFLTDYTSSTETIRLVSVRNQVESLISSAPESHQAAQGPGGGSGSGVGQGESARVP